MNKSNRGGTVDSAEQVAWMVTSSFITGSTNPGVTRSGHKKAFAHSWVRLSNERVEIDLTPTTDRGLIDTSSYGWIEQADSGAADLFEAKAPEDLIGHHLAEFFLDPREASSFFGMVRRAVPISGLIVGLRRLDGSRLIAGMSAESPRADGGKSWELTPINRAGSW